MPKYSKTLPAGEPVFVGLDLHNLRWHVTIRTSDVELSGAAIPGDWASLRRLSTATPATPSRPSTRPATSTSGSTTC